MRGDYTRLTFKPRKDHAGVLMQQGRVQLDADFNELVELVDRRFRAETVDVIGPCAVPRETPDGFRIEVTGGRLTIGRGRAYVDGLLAENHGAEADGYDPVLGELRGSAPLPYSEQPYLPEPDPPHEGTLLAYLDVWEREVTHLEDPGLVEKAIGIDTSARLQTVWQVKLARTGPGTTCDGEVEGWEELTRPSAGRLTTRSVGVPTPDDPCIVPPAGGYRGTENRLYRVEVHDAGELGGATFKWSRDNGSIASVVTEIDAARTTLTLVTVGRDGVERIRQGDWVEVTDDRRELAGEPGEMRKVDEVIEEGQQVKLASVLAAGDFDPSDPERHTRITRWDQSGAGVDANGGLITIPAGGPAAPIVLEEGVEVAFDTDSGGEFRSGDWWTFAARTADASVEELTAEPPRGVHHHYCRLAIVDLPDAVTDCRVLWPPETEGGPGCDCTVCVSPESHKSGELTIQMAVDRVRNAGGKVCLEPGFYALARPVRVAGATSVTIEGKGRRTMLVPTRGLPAVLVDQCQGVAIQDLAVRTGSAIRDTDEAQTAALGLSGVAIALRNSYGVAVERCFLIQQGEDRGAGPLIGLQGFLLDTRIRDNVLLGRTGVAGLAFPAQERLEVPASTMIGVAPVKGSYLTTYELRIEDNAFMCSLSGVALEGFAVHLASTRVAGNWITGCRRAALSALGMVGPSSRLDITANAIAVPGEGIVVGTDDARIVGNDIGAPIRRSRGDQDAQSQGGGILLIPAVRPGAIDRCLILANRIVGIAGDGISIRARVASALIKQNVIQRVGGKGIAMDSKATAEVLTVENNQVLDVAPKVEAEGSAVGIHLLATREAVVVGNTVSGVGRDAVEGETRCGIQLSGCGHSRVSGNEVVDVGPSEEFVRIGAGIGIFEPLGDVDVSDNTVRRSGEAREGGAGMWAALAVLLRPPSRPSGMTVSDVPHIASALVPTLPIGVVRAPVSSAALAEGNVVEVAAAGAPAQLSVRGNLLDAYGSAPCVIAMFAGPCQFADNRCLLAGDSKRVTQFTLFPGAGGSDSPVAASAVVDANYVSGPAGAPCISLRLPEQDRYTVLGNVGSGPIEVNDNPLPGPWDVLNAV
jgi:hypothetical protein